MRSFRYLYECLVKKLTGRDGACPSCGSLQSRVIDRKWLVTTLERCERCHLLYRSPATTEKENEEIYQEAYVEGVTTDIPSEETLRRLKETNFLGHPMEFTRYLEIIAALQIPLGAKVLDFGCSWGYGAHQLSRAGYDVLASEISKPRAKIARDRLGVSVVECSEIAKDSLDVFFSCHVMEHVPSVQTTLEQAFNLLRPKGLFVAFTPNGSLSRRRRSPKNWHQNWGYVHPQLLDEQFLAGAQKYGPVLLATTPYSVEEIKNWDKKGSLTCDLSGEELLFVIQKS